IKRICCSYFPNGLPGSTNNRNLEHTAGWRKTRCGRDQLRGRERPGVRGSGPKYGRALLVRCSREDRETVRYVVKDGLQARAEIGQAREIQAVGCRKVWIVESGLAGA